VRSLSLNNAITSSLVLAPDRSQYAPHCTHDVKWICPSISPGKRIPVDVAVSEPHISRCVFTSTHASDACAREHSAWCVEIENERCNVGYRCNMPYLVKGNVHICTALLVERDTRGDIRIAIVVPHGSGNKLVVHSSSILCVCALSIVGVHVSVYSAFTGVCIFTIRSDLSKQLM